MVPLASPPAYLRLAARFLRADPVAGVLLVLSNLLVFVLASGVIIVTLLASGALRSGSARASSAEQVVHEAMIGLSGTSLIPIAVALASAIVLLVLQALLDTVIARRARRLLAPVQEHLLSFRRHFAAFLAVHALQFAMLVAFSFFLVPLVGRLLVRLLSLASPGLLPFYVFIGLGMIALHHVRQLSMVIGAWTTWRAAFVAGAFSAGFGTAFRAPLAWFLTSLLWAIPASALLTDGLLPAFQTRASDLLSWLTLSAHMGRVWLVIVLWSALGAWAQVSIIAVIGHRIGELTTATLLEPGPALKRLFSSRTSAPSDQSVIPSAPPGFFREAPTATPIPTFTDVLGVLPGAANEDEWSFEAENSEVVAAPSSAGGAQQVSLAFRAPEPSPPTDADEDEEISLLGDAIGGDERDEEQGLARLHESLLPAVLRTVNGDAEIRYRGYRQKADAPAPSTTNDPGA